MPFPKFIPHNRIAYDRVPVQLKVLPGIRERLKMVENWQAKIRVYIDKLIEEDGG
jgi:hypothetical protein